MSMKRPTKTRAGRPPGAKGGQSGSAFIEALLAALLLAVALLGAAGVQTNAMRQASGSTLRTLADLQGRKIIEAMRVNPAGVAAGSYDVVTGAQVLPGCTEATCSTGPTIAQVDINQWYAELAAGLPNGTGSVSNAGGTFTVSVGWTDPGTFTAQTWTMTTSVP